MNGNSVSSAVSKVCVKFARLVWSLCLCVCVYDPVNKYILEGDTHFFVKFFVKG